MGISDDIKRKGSHHSTHHRHTEDIFDDYDFNLPITPPQPVREEIKRRESLEDDFFGGKHQAHHSDNLQDYYNDYSEEEKTEPEHEHNQHKSRKKHKSSEVNFGKIIFWIMALTLAGLLLWQNKSEIVNLVKVKILKQTPSSSPIESKTTDDYYTAEPTTNTNTNASLNINTNAVTTQTTTAPAIDKAGLKIEILNGNGIKNSGSTMKTTLENAGFTITNTANAKNFNYATSLIYYKTGKQAEANAVKAAMVGKDVTIENNDTLAGSYDIVIVLGAK